eukprot:CAMPEP_0170176764 /NCGR_PEP_ID=MMETSP0040_2-20121228/9564_1 /TAXON_ID=641309 /ORGANISM="Lotharella oceanica, Strain CCMP622" /LENGTH=73 /DNA_ID=CAMNT_0010419185 /DNA_START=30 /DNA_END=248 /DNA_ORIENTATION=+
MAMNGLWKLIYASEDVTRASPFFWAFRKATSNLSQPIPAFPNKLSEAIFAITDGISLAKKGQAIQMIDISPEG